MSAADAERGEAGEFLAAPSSDAAADTSHPDALPTPTSSGPAPGGAVNAILRQSSHPKAALAHVGFKLAAVLAYLLVGFFTSSFVIQFVLTVTLLAFDFWTVKNVSGRLLVGLRWWHAATPTGVGEGEDESGWRFETIPDRAAVNKTDGRIFWWALYLTPVVWVVLGVVCVLKFNMSYLVIVAIAMVLSAANIVGYYKCNKEATEQMRDYLGKTVLGHAMERTGFGGLAQFVS